MVRAADNRLVVLDFGLSKLAPNLALALVLKVTALRTGAGKPLTGSLCDWTNANFPAKLLISFTRKAGITDFGLSSHNYPQLWE